MSSLYRSLNLQTNATTIPQTAEASYIKKKEFKLTLEDKYISANYTIQNHNWNIFSYMLYWTISLKKPLFTHMS